MGKTIEDMLEGEMRFISPESFYFTGSGAGFLDLNGSTVEIPNVDYSIIIVKSEMEEWGYEMQLPHITPMDGLTQDEAEAVYRTRFSQEFDSLNPDRYVRMKSRDGSYFEGQPSDYSVQFEPTIEAAQDQRVGLERAMAALREALDVSQKAGVAVEKLCGTLGDERSHDYLARACSWNTTPSD